MFFSQLRCTSCLGLMSPLTHLYFYHLMALSCYTVYFHLDTRRLPVNLTLRHTGTCPNTVSPCLIFDHAVSLWVCPTVTLLRCNTSINLISHALVSFSSCLWSICVMPLFLFSPRIPWENNINFISIFISFVFFSFAIKMVSLVLSLPTFRILFLF